MIVGRAKTVLRFDRWWKEEREGERERDCGRVPGRMDRLSVETGTDNERYRARHVVFRTFLYLGARCDKYPVHGSLSIYGKGIRDGCWRWRFLAADSANLHERFARGGRLSKGGKLPAIYRVKREHRFIEDPSSCSKYGKTGSAFSRIDPPPLLSASFFPLFFISFYRRKVFGGKRRMIGGTRFGVKNRKTRERGDEKSRFIRSTLTF